MQRWPQIVRPQEDIASYKRQTIEGASAASQFRGRLTDCEGKLRLLLFRIGALCISKVIHFSNFFLSRFSTFTFNVFLGQRSTTFYVWVWYFIHLARIITNKTANYVFYRNNPYIMSSFTLWSEILYLEMITNSRKANYPIYYHFFSNDTITLSMNHFQTW
jgi:hypothetical protein